MPPMQREECACSQQVGLLFLARRSNRYDRMGVLESFHGKGGTAAQARWLNPKRLMSTVSTVSFYLWASGITGIVYETSPVGSVGPMFILTIFIFVLRSPRCLGNPGGGKCWRVRALVSFLGALVVSSTNLKNIHHTRAAPEYRAYGNCWLCVRCCVSSAPSCGTAM